MDDRSRLEEMNVRNEIVTNDSRSAVQSAILINGGAVAALLAFVANQSATSKLIIEPSGIRQALESFVAGVALAGLSTATVYLTNYAYLSQTKAIYESNKKIADRSLLMGNIMHWISVFLFFSSMAAFIVGALSAARAIT